MYPNFTTVYQRYTDIRYDRRCTTVPTPLLIYRHRVHLGVHDHYYCSSNHCSYHCYTDYDHYYCSIVNHYLLPLLHATSTSAYYGNYPTGCLIFGIPHIGTAPLTVQFEDASTGSPTTWDWNFGDGDSSNQ